MIFRLVFGSHVVIRSAVDAAIHGFLCGATATTGGVDGVIRGVSFRVKGFVFCASAFEGGDRRGGHTHCSKEEAALKA